MASKILDFQKKLLTDEATRKAFAQNPGKYLTEFGVQLPEGVKVPASIPIADIDAQVKTIQAALKDQNVDISQIAPSDPAAVTKFIEEAVPLKTSDLQIARGVQNAELAALGGKNPGDVATIAVVAAVVGAVVAVPVAVFGRSAGDYEQYLTAAKGVQTISRVGSGYVLTGPGGVRVEGLDAAGVVGIIKGLQ